MVKDVPKILKHISYGFICMFLILFDFIRFFEANAGERRMVVDGEAW